VENVSKLPSVPRLKNASRPLMIALGVLALVGVTLAQAPTGAATQTSAPSSATVAPPRVFAYYYLWWSASHWKSPLAAQLGAVPPQGAPA